MEREIRKSLQYSSNRMSYMESAVAVIPVAASLREPAAVSYVRKGGFATTENRSSWSLSATRLRGRNGFLFTSYATNIS